MQIFELDAAHQLKIAPQAYALLPLKAIWERDKSKQKETAKKELAYVFFNNDYKSTFFNEPDSKDRAKMVVEYVFGKDSKWEPDEVVLEAEAFYVEHQDTFSLKLLKDTMKGVNKLREYFRDINFKETLKSKTGEIFPKYDVKKFVDTVEKIPKVVESLQNIEKAVKKEQETDSKLRGGREKGMYAD